MRIFLILIVALFFVSCSDETPLPVNPVSEQRGVGYFEVIQGYTNNSMVIYNRYVYAPFYMFDSVTTLDSIIFNGSRSQPTEGFYLSGYGEDMDITIGSFNYKGSGGFVVPIPLICNTEYYMQFKQGN